MFISVIFFSYSDELDPLAAEEGSSDSDSSHSEEGEMTGKARRCADGVRTHPSESSCPLTVSG